MARATAIYTNFTGGQISDSMDGRVDTVIYQNGCKQLENFLVTQQGSAKRRQGLRFINEVKDSTKEVRLIPFEFSEFQTYILEFGDEYVRFYKDGGVILDGGSVYEITSPYTESDLFNIRFAQNKDLMYLVDGAKPIKILSRFSDTSWTLTDLTIENSPLLPEDTTGSGDNVVPNSGFDSSIDGWNDLSARLGDVSWRSDFGSAMDHGLPRSTIARTDPFPLKEPHKPHELEVYVENVIGDGEVSIGSGNGNNTVQNGEFNTDLSNWTIVSGGALWSSTNGGGCRLYNGVIRQTLTLDDETKIHEFQISTYYAGPSNTCSVKIGSTPGGSDILASTPINIDGFVKAFTLIEVATPSTTPVYIDITGNDVIIDDVGFAIKNVDDILTTTTLSNGLNSIPVDAPNVDNVVIAITTDAAKSIIIGKITLSIAPVFLKLVSSGGYSKGTEMTLTAQNGDVFEEGHVGATFKLIDDTTPSSTDAAQVKILSFTDSRNVQVVALENIPSSLQNNQTNRWQEGAWSGIQGYPSIITFFEQRLVLASTTLSPQTLWFSVSAIYNDFDIGTAQEDESFEREIASAKLNTIQWIAEAKDVLVVGTTGGEFIMSGGGENDGFTPSNVMLRKQTSYGSAFVLPINADGNILFTQRNARIMRVFGYTLERDGYLGDDATIYSDDILGTGIKEMAYQGKKSRAVWAVLNDGDIANLTYEPMQQIKAWSKQTTDGDFESVAVISGDDADEIWVVVNRTIDGDTVRYIERFEPETEDAFMVDSGLEYSGASTSTISGLDHLEGETVDVLNGGVAETQKTVSSGEITLDNPATSAIVGLPYISDLQTRRAEVASQNGPAQGKPKTIYKMIGRFSKTLGGKYSVDGENFYDLELGDSEFSADKEIMMPNGWDRYGDIYMRQDSPYPMNIQLIHLMVNTNDL